MIEINNINNLGERQLNEVRKDSTKIADTDQMVDEETQENPDADPFEILEEMPLNN